jgi:hypothetical protein
VNRIGDFGFSLAMFLIVVNFGSLDFGRCSHQAPGAPTGLLTTIGCCCWSARAANRRRFRSTSGCRTPWPVPRPSRP